jgi:hypothetical protein
LADIWKNPRNKGRWIIWSDLAQLIRAVLLMLGVLLPVINPLGDTPNLPKRRVGSILMIMSKLETNRRVILTGEIFNTVKHH